MKELSEIILPSPRIKLSKVQVAKENRSLLFIQQCIEVKVNINTKNTQKNPNCDHIGAKQGTNNVVLPTNSLQ